jgi:hypothetical protein
MKMVKFKDTDAGEDFIQSASSRGTSKEVMEAIAFFAQNEKEAQALWEGDAIGSVAHLSDIWEYATNNGAKDEDFLFWGDRKLSVIMKTA